MMEKRKSAWPYIKGYKFNSLLLKNFFYVFALVTMPLLLVLSLNYNKFADVVNNRVLEKNEELLQKNAVVTDNFIGGIMDTLGDLAQQNAIIETVQAEELDKEYYDSANEVVQLMQAQIQSNNLVVSASVYSNVNKMLIDIDGAMHIDQVSGKGKWYDIHKQTPMFYPYILVNKTNSVFACQPVWSRKGQRAGLIVVDVELDKIRNLLDSQEVAKQGIFFIVDANSQTIYCNDRNYSLWDSQKQEEYRRDIAKVKAGTSQLVGNRGNRIVSVTESAHKSWSYAFVTQAPDYKDEMHVIRGFLLSSVLLGILSSAIVAYLITILTYRPIRKIMNVIKNPQLHWNEKEATKQSNELLYITSNIMADMRNDEEISDEKSEELEERIRALRQAQFRALQFQIDPHFLYNTLETIKWSAVEEMGLGNKVSKMLTKVARLYRLGLENDDVIVTLREEIDFLKLYVEIVRIRFNDSITFHWNIDEDLYDCNIIKMCLQPVVENAIQHGLRPNNYSGNITVSAQYEDECLLVSVENDGHAITGQEIDKLNAQLKTGAGFEENKVGLRNVNERIKLIYGRKYGVSVSASKSDDSEDAHASVRVILTFPCRNFNRSEETK